MKTQLLKLKLTFPSLLPLSVIVVLITNLAAAQTTTGFKFFVKDVTVNTSTPVEFTDDTDQPLNIASKYRIHLVTRGTGSNTGAEYLVWYDPDNSTWNTRAVSLANNISNHPLLRVDNNAVVVANNHTTNYHTRVFVEELLSSESDGTPNIFGASFQWQRKTNTLFYNDGNVGIGTSTPAEKLSVNGKVRAKEVKVEATNWPDYVFEEDYVLMPLPELEKFISINGHLPEIPSADRISANGLSVEEMYPALLEKIEELTLHLIEKDKEIKRLMQLEARMTAIEQKVNNK